MTGLLYTRQQFIDFELNLYRDPEFNITFTTPFDYLGTYLTAFNLDSKQIKRLNYVLEMSLVMTDLMFNSA